MKTIGASLLAHIQGTTLTIATCWKLTLTNSTVKGFTDHTEDLVVDGVTYKAQSGYTRSAIQSTLDLSVDNLQLEGLIDSSDITEADLRAGLYDYATVEIFIVNYEDLTMGVMTLKYGTFGELTIKDNTYVAEFRGLGQRLSKEIGSIYTPDCRFDLGDSNCEINLNDANKKQTGLTVTAKTSNYDFNATGLNDPGLADSSWVYGFVHWTSGNNNGKKHEVKSYNTGTDQIVLFVSTDYDIQVGDTFNIFVGCDKTAETCKDVFNNILNFGGFHFMPSVRWVLRYPDARMSAVAGQNDGADD